MGNVAAAALFTVSALDTGVAAVSIFAAAMDRDEGIERVRATLEKAVIGLVVLEAVVLAAFVLTMQGAGADEARAIGLLTEGALGVQFWLLVVAVGLGCPLIAAITQLVASRQKGKVGPCCAGGRSRVRARRWVHAALRCAGLPACMPHSSVRRRCRQRRAR